MYRKESFETLVFNLQPKLEVEEEGDIVVNNRVVSEDRIR